MYEPNDSLVDVCVRYKHYVCMMYVYEILEI